MCGHHLLHSNTVILHSDTVCVCMGSTLHFENPFYLSHSKSPWRLGVRYIPFGDIICEIITCEITCEVTFNIVFGVRVICVRLYSICICHIQTSYPACYVRLTILHDIHVFGHKQDDIQNGTIRMQNTIYIYNTQNGCVRVQYGSNVNTQMAF